MNRQTLAITGLGVALVATLIGAGLTLNPISADITNESKAEMFNFMSENYVDVDDYENDLEEIEDAIAHPHIELNDLPGLKLAVQNIRNDIQTIRADILALERGNNPSSNNEDFNLETCEDYNCTDETSRFEAGDVVYVKGNNPSNDKSLSYRVYDSDNDRIDSRNVSMQQNGPFIIAYQTDIDSEDGTYRIQVEIDNEENEINFIIN